MKSSKSNSKGNKGISLIDLSIKKQGEAKLPSHVPSKEVKDSFYKKIQFCS